MIIFSGLEDKKDFGGKFKYFSFFVCYLQGKNGC